MYRVFVLLVVAFSTISATAADENTSFLRLHRNEDGEAVSFDTAIGRYVKEGVTVDLIGAVHVGEKQYYKRLNQQFTEYDALLYELVAEKDAIPQERDPTGNPLSLIQGGMTRMLGLTHQLDEVDYSPKNFVHADLSPKELKECMESRGDTPMVLALEAIANQMRQQNLVKQKPTNPADDTEILMSVFEGLMTGRGSPLLKKHFALQFEQMDGQVPLGGNLGKLIIDDRNYACFVVLDKQIKGGKNCIGIFYGAAHLPDMEKRLIDRGFVKTGITWVPAWDLTP